MPEANREKYKKGLQASLLALHEKTRKALGGGEPLWATNYTFLPTWGEKQILSPLGDLTKRTAPLSMELALTHLKRGMGALGLDLSLVGWMEMISGGLGDGGGQCFRQGTDSPDLARTYRWHVLLDGLGGFPLHVLCPSLGHTC